MSAFDLSLIACGVNLFCMGFNVGMWLGKKWK